MNFEWDKAKSRINYAKHRISFELACKVFDDPLVQYRFDCVKDGEERWLAVGMANRQQLLLVVYTYRDHNGEEFIRIISARRTTSHERRLYEKS